MSTSVPAVDDALAVELLALGSATLYEASGLDCFLPADLRPAWPGANVVGTALPVRTAEGDNLPLHLALEVAEPGEVLVVDAAGAPHGYWGEVLAVAAQQRGVRGLVIDGGVRDTERLEVLRFPVFSSSIAVRGTVKDDPGSVGAPLTLGSAPVTRGDIVVGDRDGIVVLPIRHCPAILAAARQRQQKEEAFLARIRAGELTLDIYGFSRRGNLGQ
ncbi:MAG TPA: 4-carboxy-4-hydroxy-2-oxoadipate aldolase/oxaloacetate decarboxylase [Mycobacteriales bacterium]|nr:4-carboxy-4-hydroxy-2-oxoadipate aldolase/oxaloacetate decarboxylase [Mycobacteriales bacterium]